MSQAEESGTIATEMIRDRKRQLRRLARLMNRQGGRWLPVTRELLDCLAVAISRQEANFLLNTGGRAMSASSLAALSGLPAEEFDALFAEILKKGLLLSQTDPQQGEVYSLAPLFIGWFEFFTAGEDTPERVEFARRLQHYFDSFRKFNIPPLRELHNLQARFTRPPQSILPLESPPQPISGNRKIVLDRTLAIPASEVHPPSSVLQIIEKYSAHEAIALIRCFCREMSRRNSQPCRFQLPSESCIVLGPMVEHAVRFGIGRRITKEDAIAKIRETAELGAMHTVFQQANLGGPNEVAICNCCRDCCVVLKSNAQGIVPLRYKAFWRVQVEHPDRCSHCGECDRRCPVDAIHTADRGPRVDNSRCVGCGLCTNTCPTGTLELVPDERYVLLPLKKG